MRKKKRSGVATTLDFYRKIAIRSAIIINNITISGATTGQMHEVVYFSPSENSTQGELTYSYPENLSAVVYSHGNMLNALSKESVDFRAFTLASLWDLQNRVAIIEGGI